MLGDVGLVVELRVVIAAVGVGGGVGGEHDAVGAEVGEEGLGERDEAGFGCDGAEARVPGVEGCVEDVGGGDGCEGEAREFFRVV